MKKVENKIEKFIAYKNVYFFIVLGYELENKHNMGLLAASFNGEAENVKEFLRKGAYVDFTNGRGKKQIIFPRLYFKRNLQNSGKSKL